MLSAAVERPVYGCTSHFWNRAFCALQTVPAQNVSPAPLVAHQLFVQRKAIPTVEDSSGKVLGRKTVEAERERALEKIAVVLEYKDRMRGGKQNGKTEYSGKSSAN